MSINRLDPRGPGANQLYGWYDSPHQSQDHPTYDPPHDAECPYCGHELDAADVRTHAFIGALKSNRSYFYRTHRTCDDAAGEGGQHSMFAAVLSRIMVDGHPR